MGKQHICTVITLLSPVLWPSLVSKINILLKSIVAVSLTVMLSISSTASDGGSDSTSSLADVTANTAFIDYGSTPGGQGDGSLDREEGEGILIDMSVSSFLDEVSWLMARVIVGHSTVYYQFTLLVYIAELYIADT